MSYDRSRKHAFGEMDVQNHQLRAGGMTSSSLVGHKYEYPVQFTLPYGYKNICS